MEIPDIAARVIKPDGAILELKKDAVLDRVAAQAGGLNDPAMVIDRADVDLDLEPADLPARPRHHQSLIVAAGFEFSHFRKLFATPRLRIRSLGEGKRQKWPRSTHSDNDSLFIRHGINRL
jgi:hypothetical protein